MYTDPVIVHGKDVKSRSYVKVFFSGQRFRFYTGKPLGINCFPNESKNIAERLRLLHQLQYEIKKKLEKGWDPNKQEKSANPYSGYTISRCITEINEKIKKEDISNRYREDLTRISAELHDFLTEEGLKNSPANEVAAHNLQRFLSRYSSSAAYYMTKRRTLTGLISRMVNDGMITVNPVHKTTRKKEVHVLNVAFPPTHLKGLLSYLEGKHPHLFLCAVIMYGCFLRPHREIRLLQRRHLNEACTTITLSGTENKSKRIRVVRLPNYVTQALIAANVYKLAPEHFLIGGSAKPVNEDYFTTVWTREKKKFPKHLELLECQTLYSFRHSGAVAVYEKTKDPFKVQQAMGHSSLTVTLRYLRSLGISLSAEEYPDL
ncbi:site-specific integrase [Paracnuella aquatica]|uniref:site-specific integrase n=1 Tax=Paracnuella aquatica TaxID=2268757 RepID=UPI000DEFC97D|nr:site-specific integrase [Paracnuella aquatica]RPD51161.1 integrase [Paracnuella aquatica]